MSRNKPADRQHIESFEPMILLSASTIEGTDAGEWIDLGDTNGNVTIDAKGGDDSIYAPMGENIIDGGDGHDSLVIYEGEQADYTVYTDSYGDCVVEGPGLNGAPVKNVIRNVEQIIFNDGWVNTEDVKGEQPDTPDDPEDPTDPHEDPSGSDKSGSDKSGSDKSGSDKSGSDKSGSDKSGSDKSGSDKSGSDKSGSDKSGSGKSGSDKSGSDKSGSDKSGSGKSGSDKSGSDKSGSDKSGSDKSGSDKSNKTPVQEPPVDPDPTDPGDDPVAEKDKFVTWVNEPVWGDLTENDHITGDFWVDLKSWPSKGYIMLNEDGTFDYVPYAGESGEDIFEYVIHQANGRRSVGHVCITIEHNGEPPVDPWPSDPTPEDPTDPHPEDPSGSGKSGSGKSGSGKSGSGKSGSGKSGSGKSGSDKSGSGKSGSGKSGSGKSGSGKSGSGKSGSGKSGSDKSGSGKSGSGKSGSGKSGSGSNGGHYRKWWLKW